MRQDKGISNRINCKSNSDLCVVLWNACKEIRFLRLIYLCNLYFYEVNFMSVQIWWAGGLDHFLRGTTVWRLLKRVDCGRERAKPHFHLRGGSLSSFRCPAGLYIKTYRRCLLQLCCLFVSFRLPQYWWPGSKRELRAPGSDSSSPLDQ